MKFKHRHTDLIRKRNRAGYFFMFPLILGIVFIFIPNVLMTLQFSMNDVKINGSEGYSLIFKGFDFYRKVIFVNAQFIPEVVKSYKDLLLNVPVILIFSIFISMLLNQKFRGRTTARAIFFLPVLLATGIFDYVEISMLGVMNSSLAATGASGGGGVNYALGNMLTNLKFSPLLIDIVLSAVSNIYGILKLSGIQIFIFLAGLQEIPIYLYEAAEVEGCSKWESFWKITFPMLAPQISVNTIYTLVIVGQGSKALSFAEHICNAEGNYGLGTSMIMIYLLTLVCFILGIFWVLSRFRKFSGV